MSWLSNFKISFKISLIVTLMGLVTIGIVLFASQRMRMMDDANTDMVTRIDKSSTMAARAGRRAENYVSSAFQLLAETTDAGNAKLLAQAADSRKDYESRMAQVLKDLPEKAGVIKPVVADFEKAAAACDPVIKFASTTTTPSRPSSASRSPRSTSTSASTSASSTRSRSPTSAPRRSPASRSR